MRYVFFSFLIPFYLLTNSGSVLGLDNRLQFDANKNLKSSTLENFDTGSRKLLVRQKNLITYIQQALLHPDSNKMRTVGGKLITQAVVVESFLKAHYPKPKALCNRNHSQEAFVDSIPPLSSSNLKVYCSLYNSTRELSKLTPILDRLLTRRGELALVRELPLVSGEKQSDLVLPMSPINSPKLGEKAIPYAILEPSVERDNSLLIGKRKKSAIANYVPPVQPAIKPPSEALAILQNAEQFLLATKFVFPVPSSFQNKKTIRAKFDRLSYGVNLQDKQIYQKLLLMPNTGIFRVLPHRVYLRSLNTIENRSQKNILGRYPFPILSQSKGNFKPNLPLQIVKGKFKLLSGGVDYAFMADIGDIPLEDLDTNLKIIDEKKRDFFINYQPPQKLDRLVVERRKVISGRYQKLSEIDAKLNHTYLVRNLQFQLPEIITNNQVLTRNQRRYIDQLLRMQSSDVILAFRPVRRHGNGSYTIIWRVLQELNDPKIKDLEDHLKYQ